MRNRNVLEKVVAKISTGEILTTYKTKALPVGRKLVSVGRYHTADGERSYALIIGGNAAVDTDVYEIARAFIKYVGRDDAWNATHGRGRQRN